MSLPQRGLWLDAQGAQNRAHFDRGIPRYVTEQLRNVVGIVDGAVHTISLNPRLPLTGNLDWLLGSEHLRWAGAATDGRSQQPQLYHAMSPFEMDRSMEEVWPRWARDRSVRTVVTLFDLIPLVFNDHYLSDPRMRSRYLARAQLVRRADQVLALSQTTADDATRLLGVRDEHITVIDAGVSNHFADAYGTRSEAERIVGRRFPGLRPGFMLYVAGIEFRKNLERLIAAYGLTGVGFRAAHQLVITCRMQPDAERELRRGAAEAGLREDDLILTNYVSDADLAALYRTCELFVFASFYEGSGLPMLEAMACGVPVVASKTSTSPEILGDREGLFDPFGPADIARTLESTLSDDALMERLRRRSTERVSRYTWDHVARRSLEGYERALARPQRRLTRRRPRIAMFTPWPPDRSGIASYNHRLLQELGRHVDVDVVVGGGSYAPPQEPGVQLVHADQFASRQPLRAYGRVLYCMGNSAFHGYVYEALARERGIVVAHDVRLTGFYGWYAGQERPNDPVGRLNERIAAMYGSRLGAPFTERGPTPAETSAFGIFMTQEIQDQAEQIVVHSRYAADVLRLDAPPGRARSAPVTVLPHAFATRPQPARRPVDPAAPLIITFGIVSSVKNPRVLIEAFALLAAGRPGAKLVFAGDGDEEELRRWRELAAQTGVADRVAFEGHTSPERWEELLVTADLAVQLRLVSNGEASAAVTECLSAGLPTIVTDHGWFAELPDAAVVKIPMELTAPVLATAMANALDDPDRRASLQEAGRAHAEANSFAAVAELYLELL